MSHAGHQSRSRTRPGFRLLPDIKFITWLFSLATRVVLLAILAGVLGFLLLFAYFLAGRTWSMPVVLSAGHERVIKAQHDWLETSLKLADTDSRVQVLRRQLLETENNMAIARIGAAAEANAIRTETRQNDLEINSVENAIARGVSVRQIASNLLLRIGELPDPEKNFDSGLVNRARFLSDMLARADLSIKIAALESTVAENAARLAALQGRRNSLRSAQAIVEGRPADQLGSREFEYVRIWNKATLDLRTGSDENQRLRQNMAQLEALHTEVVDSLRRLAASPLLAAAHEPAVVVFVPYGNGPTYKTGQPIYRCRLWLVLCSSIGTIGPFVDGETTFPHPFFRGAVRGSFYSIELTADKQAAQDLLLFSTLPLLF